MLQIVLFVAATTLALLGTGASAQPEQTAPSGVITGVGNFSHIVADMDRALAFYRDAIGLEISQPLNEFSGNPAVIALANAPGAQVRWAVLRVPGSPLGVELIEYKDIARRPVSPRFQDPGAANLILTVRDIDAVLGRVERSTGRVQTPSGKPATIQGGTRVIFVQDPDGFFIELLQPATAPPTAPPTTAPASSNVIGSGFELMVEDTGRTMRFWRDALGFDVQVGTTFDATPLLLETAGTPGAEFKRSAARIPGTSVTMAFLEFRKITRKKIDTRFPDPGTPVLQLRTRDIDGVTQAWKAAGGEVVSVGGAPVAYGNSRLIVLRDPSGLMVELLPSAQPR